MALPEPIPSTTTSSDNKLEDEATLITALATLDSMHQKLISLRQSIPRMIQPITSPASYSTPEQLFDEFSKRTLRASEEVVVFTKSMVDGMWVLDLAKRSREADGEGIRRWRSTAPAQLPRKTGDEKVVEEEKKEETVEEEEEDYAVVVEAFKKEHPDYEVNLDKSKNEIKLKLSKPTSFVFTISLPSTTSSTKRKFVISSPSTTKLSIAILRSLTARENPGSLKFLLGMISQYEGVFGTKCAGCGCLTGGPRAELAVVRRLVRTKKTVKKVKEEGKDAEEEDVVMTEGGEEKTEGRPEEEKEKEKSVNKEDAKEEKKKEKSVKKEDTKEKDKDYEKTKEEEEEEEEVTEEKWVAYHESCVDK